MAFVAAAPAIWAAIASAAVSATTAIVSSQQQAKAYEAQADAQKQQAKLAYTAEQNKNAKILGKQQAIAGASGLNPDTGSPLELALDTAFQGENNALIQRQQGMYKARTLKYQANQARTSGYIDAFSGLLKSSGTFMSGFMK